MKPIVRIGCCDFRTAKDGVYFLGTVGAKVGKEMIADLGFLLEMVGEVQLVGHEDCLAARRRLGLPTAGELEPAQRQRLAEETERFLDQNARELTGSAVVRSALERGVSFRVGVDNNRGSIRWLNWRREIG